MIRVSVDPAPIELAVEVAALEERGAGGVATFTGVVRGDGGVTELTLEHYPGMTEAALIALAETATARWSLLGVTIVHRVGPMHPGERIVFEPYSREVFEESFKWVAKHEIFADGRMGSGDYDLATVSFAAE